MLLSNLPRCKEWRILNALSDSAHEYLRNEEAAGDVHPIIIMAIRLWFYIMISSNMIINRKVIWLDSKANYTQTLASVSLWCVCLHGNWRCVTHVRRCRNTPIMNGMLNGSIQSFRKRCSYDYIMLYLLSSPWRKWGVCWFQEIAYEEVCRYLLLLFRSMKMTLTP